ncbi:hypothetical protein [Streptomyces sp. NPDC085540]|uniref:hypothetical protein n=1 Tax=Streptomyces sp. NPDC085540 TaxID=3365730 RepID=UPI0037CED3B7
MLPLARRVQRGVLEHGLHRVHGLAFAGQLGASSPLALGRRAEDRAVEDRVARPGLLHVHPGEARSGDLLCTDSVAGGAR